MYTHPLPLLFIIVGSIVIILPLVYFTEKRWARKEFDQGELAVETASKSSESSVEMIWKIFRTIKLPAWLLIAILYTHANVLLRLFGINLPG